MMFPETIDLHIEGVPFERLESAHNYASIMSNGDGKRRRVVYRRVAGVLGIHQYRRWVVLPAVHPFIAALEKRIAEGRRRSIHCGDETCTDDHG